MKFEEFIKSYNEIIKAYNRLYHAFALKIGLSDSALTILYELRIEGKEIAQKDLGESLSLSKQTVNSSIKCLTNMGLVELKDSEVDKRSKIVVLTNKGEELCLREIDKIIMAEEQAFCKLSDVESHMLIETEKKYYKFLLEESEKVMDR